MTRVIGQVFGWLSRQVQIKSAGGAVWAKPCHHLPTQTGRERVMEERHQTSQCVTRRKQTGKGVGRRGNRKESVSISNTFVSDWLIDLRCFTWSGGAPAAEAEIGLKRGVLLGRSTTIRTFCFLLAAEINVSDDNSFPVDGVTDPNGSRTGRRK